MTASELFSNHLIQNVLVQRQIRHKPLQSRVLVLELAQSSQFAHPQARVLLLPDVEPGEC